jgi:hypothetical protein
MSNHAGSLSMCFTITGIDELTINQMGGWAQPKTNN